LTSAQNKLGTQLALASDNWVLTPNSSFDFYSFEFFSFRFFNTNFFVNINQKTFPHLAGFEQLSSSIGWRVMVVQSDARKVAQIASTNISYAGAEGAFVPKKLCFQTFNSTTPATFSVLIFLL